MRSTINLIVLLALIQIGCSSKRGAGKLEGTWAPIVSNEVTADSSINHIPKGQIRLKHFTKNHYVWIAYSAGEKKFYAAGGGTYTFQDDLFTEHIDFFSEDSSMVGQILPFKCTVRGDTLWQSGMVGDMKIEEMWKKIE